MNFADMRANGPAISPTGRVVRGEPNLQGIPVRTTEGRGIRNAFVDYAKGMSLSAQSERNFSTAQYVDPLGAILGELK
ncbi:hypothetical protein [Burkholderia cenocepacia]|uniref:hypothetical protein n=1 Tax=Burkholderia cenocepacia TaxID=95486 RepID=UPI00076D2633|nr:hypothetical protein [Burkholderia cenocepacia]KWU24771.1 hypothetical protein AS149_32005 [Burkholderia cenocepacia]